MGWRNQLIGASFHLTNVALYAADFKRVQPFGGEPDGPSSSLLFMGCVFVKVSVKLEIDVGGWCLICWS
jgi:hypothetical protein